MDASAITKGAQGRVLAIVEAMLAEKCAPSQQELLRRLRAALMPDDERAECERLIRQGWLTLEAILAEESASDPSIRPPTIARKPRRSGTPFSK